MKHSGKARRAGLKLILISLLVLLAMAAVWVIAWFIMTVLTAMAAVLVPVAIVAWLLWAVFTLYFFRDPNPSVPAGPNLILAPAHGKVDVVGTTTERDFLGGECQRISIFLSVFDVHVQNAPISGKITWFKYTAGQFVNAMRAESATLNENVLLGFESSDSPGQKVGVRLIAGVIARRIVPFVQQGEEVVRGDRISLIQFGSRADVYLPRNAVIRVKLGDHVVGGETVLAVFS